jgi:hypothetical protein
VSEPRWTTAENLQEGEEFDAGEQTEEPLILTVSLIVVEDASVYIYTKELAFPLRANVGEQVTYADE